MGKKRVGRLIVSIIVSVSFILQTLPVLGDELLVDNDITGDSIRAGVASLIDNEDILQQDEDCLLPEDEDDVLNEFNLINEISSFENSESILENNNINLTPNSIENLNKVQDSNIDIFRDHSLDSKTEGQNTYNIISFNEEKALDESLVDKEEFLTSEINTETYSSSENVLIWPLPGFTRANIARSISSGHNGMDINGTNVNGTKIVAAKDGEVVAKYTCSHQLSTSESSPSCCWGYGTGLCIQGTDGRYYGYAHMQAGSIPSNIGVGSKISAGQFIGKVGSTGKATGPHLHFQITTKNQFGNNGGSIIDPQKEEYDIDNPEPGPDCDCEMTRGVDKIKNGEYVLVSEKSLDDSGKIRKDNPYVIDIDNRDVVIERKLSSDSPIWEIELIENRFYNIYNRKTDKAMSLEEDSKKRLTNIHVGKYKESDHTAWWSFDEMWPGKFIIENRYSEMCATICSGDSIKQKEFLGKSDCETQTWLLVRPDKPTIKTTTIPNGEIGKEYATSLVGECDEWIAIEWSLANDSGALPEGLSLSKDGVISGTPTKAGDYAIKINATNEFGTTTQSYILSITGPAVVPVTSVSLSKTSLEMNEGGSVTLTASVTPGDATDKTLTWKSSNEKVVTVSTSGKVTAIKAGTATITATSVSNSNKSASCTVKVNPLIVAVNSVNLDKTTISMNEGDTATLKATIAPDNASNKSVTWKSSDEKVATVSSTGKVTAVKEGTATITATSNSNKDKSASCKVTVKTKPSGILIKADDVIVMVGKTVSVPVRISGNTGLGGIALTVTNDSGLVLEKIEKGSLLSTGTFNTDTNSGMIQWYTSNAAVKGDGILFTLHVKRRTERGAFG